MSSSLGRKLKVHIFGQSHSPGLGVVIDGFPAGFAIDFERVNAFLHTRAGGRNRYSTQRKESDMPAVISGLVNGSTCGAPLCATFENKTQRTGDYDSLRDIPRPSHADYAASIKYRGHQDASGGGHFSGRLTLPLCFAGAVCMQLLETKGITVGSHIYSVGNVSDVPFDSIGLSASDLNFRDFPTVSREAGERMVALMESIAEEGDSIGGIVECGVVGLPPGLGDPMFDTLEGMLAYGLFGIPAVKGVEFGTGFGISQLKGSAANDFFKCEGESLVTETNHSGGIQGGISNGMPLILRAAIKPTPSIYKEQRSVNLRIGENVTFRIEGRHDPCIVPRAVPCVTAVTAIILCDILFGG